MAKNDLCRCGNQASLLHDAADINHGLCWLCAQHEDRRRHNKWVANQRYELHVSARRKRSAEQTDLRSKLYNYLQEDDRSRDIDTSLGPVAKHCNLEPSCDAARTCTCECASCYMARSNVDTDERDTLVDIAVDVEAPKP
jgi:hypothetical protein